MEKIENLSTYKKMQLAKQGRDKDLDILVNDENGEVRYLVAKQGRDQDLDILVNDEDRYVRYKVARHGRDKDLDILVNDKDCDVLSALMEHKRPKDIERLKERIQNGEFNDLKFVYEKRFLKEMKNIIKNKTKEKDDDFER
ncbi:HEAT repeat domain-containing protein [uncultured Sneathia sp.]|uniref:HEAT repeat domain-containing protein n=1 Tax=uncultured Sneathia sp. TaxID=278067 RepID=UPI002589EF33|nr:HEAT repeat domain-containing protein [uncultured Sneathia sp.]